MAGLWMAVVLALVLSAGNSLAVDQNRLTAFVNGLLREYGTQGMFSLAVSIPDDQNPKQSLQEVFNSDPGNNVKNTMNINEVYNGSRVVAAKLLRRQSGGADHAESRVVDYLDSLLQNRNNRKNRNDSLLFYVYASPCVEKCSSNTHKESILKRITRIFEWSNYSFVFSKIFRPNNVPANTDQQRREALQRLGQVVGLNNIFRCDSITGWKSCTSCSDNGQVADYCVSDSSSSTCPRRQAEASSQSCRG